MTRLKKDRYARKLYRGSLLAMATLCFLIPAQNAHAYTINPFPLEHRLVDPLSAVASAESRSVLVRYTIADPTGPGCVLPPRTAAPALSLDVLRLLSRPRQA